MARTLDRDAGVGPGIIVEQQRAAAHAGQPAHAARQQARLAIRGMRILVGVRAAHAQRHAPALPGHDLGQRLARQGPPCHQQARRQACRPIVRQPRHEAPQPGVALRQLRHPRLHPRHTIVARRINGIGQPPQRLSGGRRHAQAGGQHGQGQLAADTPWPAGPPRGPPCRQRAQRRQAGDLHDAVQRRQALYHGRAGHEGHPHHPPHRRVRRRQSDTIGARRAAADAL
ncbi:hypothetical protein L494_2360 [Bordetella bronchiseptica CA90 BB1334]|nr:hypothetical protein L494_2360 [Bordetella bronchiseptica CA90 BB1334]